MDVSESEYGLTLTLHSKANSDIYKNNRPSAFTNNLKHPIRLSLDEQYELCLANIHSPAYQSCLLKKSDINRNGINFHIGMFMYNEDESDWELMQDSKIDLWSYSLNRDISGLELDNDVSRTDFIKRFYNGFNINSEQINLVKRKCLSIFNSFLRHKYDEGHTAGPLLGCGVCETLFESDGSGRKKFVGNITPGGNDIFQEFDLSERDHLRFKHVNDLLVKEKYHIFDLLMWVINVDLYGYIINVLHKYRPEFTKYQARRIIHKMFKPTGEKFTKLQDIFTDNVFKKMWSSKGKVPQMALYASFGDKMSKYFSIGEDKKMVVVSCGYEDSTNMVDFNPILTPKFVNQKIGSLLVYSDLVKKSVRFASHITNLLGIVTINNDLYNKPNPPTIYRPISHNFVQSVSVQITDENGDELNFNDDSYVALEILIRKRR